MNDLNARIQAQAGTNAIRKKLDFLMRQSPMICFEVTLEGTILFVSPSILSIS